ncbi:MAG: hypothetical protein ACKVU4_09965 [Phycisphaerales bacterium]
MARNVTALVAAAVLGACASGASAQTAPVLSERAAVAIDSGPVANNAPAGAAALVWSGMVHVPRAPWLRLKFDQVALAGQVGAGNGAYLLLTSMQDGGQQPMNARAIGEWSHTSAYFNGDAVLVELYAYPGTGPSRVVMSEVTAGVAGMGPQIETICGPTDDRVLSSDPRNARLMPIGCTAWLIDLGNCANRFLTAGHCISTTTTNAVVQFNVPLSSASGTPINPAPQDQYPVIQSSIQSNNGLGVGLDGAQFFSAVNSVSNQAPRFVQNAAYTVASAAPQPSSQVTRVTGYGVTSAPITPTWSQVQKTHTGAFVSRNPPTALQYTVDTTGGNSGSPVILESTGEAIGIHTHGGCTSTGGSNSGTAIDYPTVQGYLANPLAGCIPFGPLSIAHTPVTLIPPGTPTVLNVQVTPNTQQVVPGSPTLHFRTAPGAFTTVALTSTGGNSYQGTLPSKDCTDAPQYYFSALGTGGTTVTLPQTAPGATFNVGVGVTAVQTVAAFDFNAGLPAGWTTSGLWNMTTNVCGNPATGCAAGGIAYYGSTTTCTFQTGTTTNSGNLTSAPIALPAVPPGAALTLEYCSSLITEALAGWDSAEVFVNNVMVDAASESSGWQTRSVNLGAFAGQTVTIRFEFDTVDGQFNNFRGWQVDNVTLKSTVVECGDCYADCNNSGSLTVADFGCFQGKYVLGDLYADCNASGTLTVGDFGCFQGQYVLGCP